MRKMWRKLFGISALAFMFCLTGLIMSGEAQAQRFVDMFNGDVVSLSKFHTFHVWPVRAGQ